ncbi:MAG: HAD family hydrolase [Planctomycetota bacterium]
MAILILFDLDGTLLKTLGTGIRAIGMAGRELVGDHFNEHAVDYAGRLDPNIIVELLQIHDVDASEESVQRFRDGYCMSLELALQEGGPSEACPGVFELLDRLEMFEEVTLGLVTGNYPETGTLKLAAAGIDVDRFPIRGWASESPNTPPVREDLPAFAMKRFTEVSGFPIQGNQVIVIGDTPADIRCARANGCRALAVATGPITRQVLESHDPDLVVDDLSKTEELLKWMLEEDRSASFMSCDDAD